MWFHEPVRVDDWVLVDLQPERASDARGTYLGTIRGPRTAPSPPSLGQECLPARRCRRRPTWPSRHHTWGDHHAERDRRRHRGAGSTRATSRCARCCGLGPGGEPGRRCRDLRHGCAARSSPTSGFGQADEGRPWEQGHRRGAVLVDQGHDCRVRIALLHDAWRARRRRPRREVLARSSRRGEGRAHDPPGPVAHLRPHGECRLRRPACASTAPATATTTRSAVKRLRGGDPAVGARHGGGHHVMTYGSNT